ncbi:MAG: M81 family metallopeptidase [Pseudomonadota bacterium]
MTPSSNPRVAILGFALESNRSAPVSTKEDFVDAFYLDAASIQAELDADRARLPGTVQGFCAEMDRSNSWTPVPILLAEAPPGGPAEHGFFSEMLQTMRDELAAAGPVDAVYISEHGAGLSTQEDDADGAVFALAREMVGPEVPIVATLDLHGHVTPRMQGSVDAMVAYLTNPHVDQRERGAEAAQIICAMLAGLRTTSTLIKVPMISPAVSLLTARGPFADLVSFGQTLVTPPILNVSILPGFAPANASTNGMSIVVTADASAPDAPRAAQQVAEQIAGQAWADRHRYEPHLTTLDEAARLARTATEDPDSPAIILADVADNPGAGGRGNTMYILRRLHQERLSRVVFGLIIDPELAAEAHDMGVGARFRARFNRNETTPFSETFEADANVLRIARGDCLGRRGLFEGRRIDLGQCALLDLDGIQVAVATARQQLADPAFLERLGLEIAGIRVLVVKSRGHFRAGFDEHHAPDQIFEVDVPGLTTPVLSNLGLDRVPRPIYPLDPEMAWRPTER